MPNAYANHNGSGNRTLMPRLHLTVLTIRDETVLYSSQIKYLISLQHENTLIQVFCLAPGCQTCNLIQTFA